MCLRVKSLRPQEALEIFTVALSGFTYAIWIIAVQYFITIITQTLMVAKST